MFLYERGWREFILDRHQCQTISFVMGEKEFAWIFATDVGVTGAQLMASVKDN